jgi:hypothetical protein
MNMETMITKAAVSHKVTRISRKIKTRSLGGTEEDYNIKQMIILSDFVPQWFKEILPPLAVINKRKKGRIKL